MACLEETHDDQFMRENSWTWSIACLGMLLAWTADGDAQPVPDQVTERSVTLCRACHRDKFESHERNPHRVLDTPAWQQRTAATIGCLACHESVAEHIGAGGGPGNVFAFRAESPLAQNEVCLGCHADTHPDFDRSPHGLAGLACSDCHEQHGSSGLPRPALLQAPESARLALDNRGAESRICANCHGDVLTEFAFNEHHRLREGVLECTSCHDPHAPQTRSLLGGFKQQQCLDCHRDKGGPFVFEHAASRVEGCTACHSPHGSPNRHMLTHQRVAEMCFSCHAAVPQFHIGFAPGAPPRFGLDTQCTNCHSAIHGSNLHPAFLR